jgi:hypothetical protein
MAAYRRAAGIEFDDNDDAMLDRWLNGAGAVWKQEIKCRGDSVNLADVLEKAIAGGMRAVGLSVASGTRRMIEPNRSGRNLDGLGRQKVFELHTGVARTKHR